MANRDWPNGLRPVTNGVAGTTPQIRPYTKVAGIIYEGDILYNDEGGVAVYNGTTDAHGDNIVGVAAHYAATGTDDKVHVYDDPSQEYVVQVDDSSISTTTNLNDAILRHAPIVYASGNTTTLQSKVELDGSGITNAWTVDNVLFIVRPWESEDNEIGEHMNVVVKIDHRNHIITNDSATRIT